MDFLVLRVFPVVLAIGAVALAVYELRSPFREGRSSLRRFRRMTGATILLGMSGMIWFGQLPPVGGGVPNQEAVKLLQYWLAVLGMAGILMIFALWDILDGVRTLRGYLDSVEKEEIGKIRSHLENAKPPR